jgi:signal transduction histidine kinase
MGEVCADKAQIESVIMNLVSNAFDAMEGKPGRLEILLSQVELDKNDTDSDADLEEGRYAKIRIADTGSGMDEDCMKRIFEPFYTTKKVGTGTGLGLSTVYGIVTNHGGTIKVSSELGVGTTFDVYLPLVATEVEHEVSARGD